MEPEIYSESNLKSGNTIEVRHGGGLAAGGWAVELKRAQRGGAASRGDGRVAAGCGLASNCGWRRPRFAWLAGLGRGPPCPAGEREAAEVRGLSSGWSGCAGEGGGAGNWWSGWIGGEKAVRTTTVVPNSTIIQYIYSNIKIRWYKALSAPSH